MYQERIQRILAYLQKQGIDAALITLPKHVYYLTGFLTEPHERFMGLVIPAAGEPSLIVPALDREAAAEASGIKQILTHTDTDNPYEVLKQALPSGLNKLGLEKSHMTLDRFETMSALVSAGSYVDIEEPLREMRLIKTADEVARIKHAVKLVEDALDETVKKVKPGVTETELVAELEYQMKRLGAEGPSFASMVLAGEKSALPHGNPGDRDVREGELLLFDIGVSADGYVSDITRTFAVGDISDQLRDIYATVLAANEAAIAEVRPGVTFAHLDQTARGVIEAKGYGEYFMHRLGHGLGMDVHEYPSVHGQNQEELRPGMVFTIEPGVYVPGVGGVRIEDDVLVTEDGCEVLTRYPKELTVIGKG
ncbi:MULTISPECIES: M24 family metallopeptidase [Brevibacillus]|uniref:Xaa-Pro dipeptidase/Xaa-Pro aminopeptidase n=1 Tax=Brevibacillus borstelensis AK1 TaxID=1300222 RepID=M8DUV3_9BACL|nr:Xaa-Pro peptidase family protein [Brevibacillus borstelensis]EMT50771.1 Xaa-Pro dipeptidase/Xaa-Pro aminopeptidase [Brevibacillus borstelensis AK1]MED1743327.1 Xaa-Pro peptidase family protein [Brevibacillus borstelensis]MED1874532.1 Xaa-Pro peptidase family protein [Brevibacillus borstelensis]MED1885430.1 Xaa-Pro peptidase family protein [Brevibacillus borstelensis]WNF04071.1 Xaa-Pro peptidase family protein [Brevibacillus borstelensis]